MGKSIKQAVIIAGGMGTRLKPFTDSNPKPMYCFNDIPFIEYLVKQVKSFGIEKILILCGYLPEKIMDYLGDGSDFGVSINYDVTPVKYETGARLRHALTYMENDFLFMYCDNYCPINFEQLIKDYETNNAMIQLTAYANKDGYTKSNLLIAGQGEVLVYDKKRTMSDLQGVDIGYAVVNRKVIESLPDGNVNFEEYVYSELVREHRLFATVCEHRYYSVGSWERIELTKKFFGSQKYIFLDRDGTLNVRPPKACYIEKPEDFVWLDGAKEAIKMLNDAGYFIILISNQPGIARGNLTEETLQEIHNKMQCDLQEIGASIDKIYYCPHNWDDGCECRKPQPGMFFMAQKEYSINLTKCYMLGDDERDMEAGKKAGCKCILVDENNTLLECVKKIIGGI